MANPAKDIKNVMDIIVMLVTGNLKPTWMDSKKLLADHHILQKLKYFDKENVSRLVLGKCRDIISSNKLNAQRVQKASKAAIIFFNWAYALVCMYHSPLVQISIRKNSDIERALNVLR